jgi:hypothetical protein
MPRPCVGLCKPDAQQQCPAQSGLSSITLQSSNLSGLTARAPSGAATHTCPEGSYCHIAVLAEHQLHMRRTRQDALPKRCTPPSYLRHAAARPVYRCLPQQLEDTARDLFCAALCYIAC